MCDYGIVSGPLIASALSGAGVASASAAPAIATAVASIGSTAIYAGAGTLATMYGQQQSQKAANDVAQQASDQNAALAESERQRQLGIADQKKQIFNDTLKSVSPDAKNADQAAADDELAAKYRGPATDAVNSILPGVPATGSADAQQAGPRVVADAYDKGLKGVGDFLTKTGNAKAGMDAFTRSNLMAGDKLNAGSNSLGLLNSFANNSQSILPIEQSAVNSGANIGFQNAQYKGDSAQALGSLLSTVGISGGLLSGGKTVKVPKKNANPSFLPDTYADTLTF